MKKMEYIVPEIEVMEAELDSMLAASIDMSGDDDNAQFGGEGDPSLPLD